MHCRYLNSVCAMSGEDMLQEHSQKKQAELRDLKEYRKLADQQMKKMEFHLFKALTREYVGEDVYMEIIKKMETDLEAYKVSGCMMHEYTRSQHMSSVTSINKL